MNQLLVTLGIAWPSLNWEKQAVVVDEPKLELNPHEHLGFQLFLHRRQIESLAILAARIQGEYEHIWIISIEELAPLDEPEPEPDEPEDDYEAAWLLEQELIRDAQQGMVDFFEAEMYSHLGPPEDE